MSYDLILYKEKTSSINNSDIRDYLSHKIPNMSKSNHLGYYNKETGVYFSFEYTRGELDEHDSGWFTEFENLGWTFNLNYLRPQFYGLEAFSFLQEMIDDLNIFIYNPQVGGAEYPAKYHAQNLFENWSNFNSVYSSELYDQLENYYLDEDKSNKSWNYNKQRVELQKQLGNHISVPSIFYFIEYKSGETKTVSVWSESNSTVFPDVDYFIIQKRRKRLFKKKLESGLINSVKIKQTFDKFLSQENGISVIMANKTKKISKLFNNLKFEFCVEKFGETIPVDKIVNRKR